MNKQIEKESVMDKEAGAKHQANVDAIRQRGHFNRVTAKLRYWADLKATGYELTNAEEAEVSLLKIMLAEVIKGMVEAGAEI